MEVLAKDIGFKALTDGFCEIYGEKHRDFFLKNGSELIELGYENGKLWVDALINSNDRLSFNFKMIQDGIMEKSKGEEILKDLRKIFPEEEVQKFVHYVEKNHETYPGNFMKGIGVYEAKIKAQISEKEVKLITTKHFDYFKRFPLSITYKSVTLFGEGGLGLDEYNENSQAYMKSEGELCYAIESIGRKYHHFGQLLYKEDALVNWIRFISDNLTNETNYWIAGFFRDVICVLSRDVHTEEIIKSIQVTNKIDIDKSGFISHKQVSAKLSQIAKNR